MKTPNDPNRLVLAHRATSSSEAEIVRSLLADAGLQASIPDRHMPIPIDLTPADGQYSVVGCDVLVPARELEEARELIAEAREQGSETEDDAEDDDE